MESLNMWHSVLIAILILASSAARAEVRAPLAFQGDHRPGMFMPVQVEGATRAMSTEITGSGLIATRTDAVVPVLVLRSPNGFVMKGSNVERTLRTVPVAGWEPGLPSSFRRQTLLIAALFTILATAAALWQTKRAVVAIVAIAAIVVLTVAGAHLWQQRRSATSAASARAFTNTYRMASRQHVRRTTLDRSRNFSLTRPPATS